MKKQQGFFQSRKFKYGTVSVLLTVVVIAAVIVLNVIFTALSSRYGWYVDMTRTDVFSMSESTIDLLKDLEGSYKIIFCMPLDKLSENTTSKMIYTCARDLEMRLDNVTIEYLDVNTYPDTASKYKLTSTESIYTTDVIIESETGHKKYSQEAFFMLSSEDSSVIGFNGELKFASAMMQLAGMYHPMAVFTSGHGETYPEGLGMLFESAGFDIKIVNLTEEVLPENAKVIVINAPQFDFIGYNEDGITNEISVLDDFLENHGSLMVFKGSDTPYFPELEEYLEEWGIQFGDAVLKDMDSSTTSDGLTIKATLPTEGTGASLHQTMRELSSVPMTIVKDASPIYQLYETKNNRSISSVLTTSKTAQAFSSENEEAVRGQFSLMTLSMQTDYVNNEPTYSYVLACSSASFADSVYMSQSAYGNRDIIYASMRLFGVDQVPVDIRFKQFEDNALTISTAEASTWTVALVAVIPVLILAVGTVVWVKRRHL